MPMQSSAALFQPPKPQAPVSEGPAGFALTADRPSSSILVNKGKSAVAPTKKDDTGAKHLGWSLVAPGGPAPETYCHLAEDGKVNMLVLHKYCEGGVRVFLCPGCGHRWARLTNIESLEWHMGTLGRREGTVPDHLPPMPLAPIESVSTQVTKVASPPVKVALASAEPVSLAPSPPWSEVLEKAALSSPVKAAQESAGPVSPAPPLSLGTIVQPLKPESPPAGRPCEWLDNFLAHKESKVCIDNRGAAVMWKPRLPSISECSISVTAPNENDIPSSSFHHKVAEGEEEEPEVEVV